MIIVSRAKNKDLPEIVEIHKAAFTDFFLTELGDSFLQLYYNSVLNCRNGILLSCFNDNVLIGFCAATKESVGFNASLVRKEPWRFGLIGLRLLFTRPVAIWRLLMNFTKSDKDHTDKGDYAELLSIGVLPTSQGLGIGKALLSYLEQELKNNSTERLSLTTDYYHNEKAIRFYFNLGFAIQYDFISYPNRKMYRLIKDLS